MNSIVIDCTDHYVGDLSVFGFAPSPVDLARHDGFAMSIVNERNLRGTPGLSSAT